MIRSIIRSSMQFRYLVVVLAGVLVLYGITQIRDMPVDVLPEFSPPYVEIQTEALGLSAEEVEQMVTVPMEQDLLAGVAWLDVIRSESVAGLSSILVTFEPGTDLYQARQMVSERLAQAAVGIPHVTKPPMMIQPTSSTSRFLIVGLSSQKLSLIEMSVLARWTIGPRLLSVPGVANVAIWGNRDRQLQVLVDPERMREAGVTLDQIVATTGNALWVSPLSFLEASSPGTGGFIDTPNQRLGIWHVLPISSPEELGQVPVERTSLILADMTNIVEDHQPLIGDALVEDTPNLLLVIERLPGTNALDVTAGVEDAIAALRPGFADVQFDSTVFRPATFIENAIRDLTRTLIGAALLMVVLLSLLFHGWRPALVSLLVIPISLIAALLVLHRLGATLNIMVLAGLVMALGIVIDEAVVDVERILRCLEASRAEGAVGPAEKIILDASSHVRGSLFFATSAALLVVLPLFLLKGTAGALFQPLAISYTLALAAAMLTALLLTATLSRLVLSGGQAEWRPSPLLLWLRRGYEQLLSKALARPRTVWLSGAVLLAAGLATLPFLWRTPSLPTFREPYLMVRFDGAPATSLPEMDRIASRASNELRGIPGVKNVAAHVGRAVNGDQVVAANSAYLWVSIDPVADYDATAAAIRETVEGYPGLGVDVLTYLKDRLDEPQQAAVRDPFTVRIFGGDHKVLLGEAEKVQDVLAGIPGVQDTHAEFPVEEPTIQIEADLQSAQRYGVKPGDVRRAAAILLSGLQVGSLFEEQKVFDVVVWSVPASRGNMSSIRHLLIDTPGGGHVSLGEVADVRIASAPTVIRREALSPYIDVGFGIGGRNMDSVLKDVRSVMQSYPFPQEYHAQILDNNAAQRSTRVSILVASLLAGIGVLLLVQAASRNWRLSLTVLLSLSLVLAGGLLGAVLARNNLSLAALFALFALFGLAVRSAVLLIQEYLSLERGGETFGEGLILRGAGERLAPTLTTLAVTAGALLPFAFFGRAAGLEIVGPAAIIILGGLMASALLNLFVLPLLYQRFGSMQEADPGLDPAEAD